MLQEVKNPALLLPICESSVIPQGYIFMVADDGFDRTPASQTLPGPRWVRRRVEVLVPLKPTKKAVLIIRGFTSSNDLSRDYYAYLSNLHIIDPTLAVYGFHWDSGQLGELVMRVSFLLAALISRGSARVMNNIPLEVIASVMEKLSNPKKTWREAKDSAELSASDLIVALKVLSDRYENLVLIAHSLGCYLVQRGLFAWEGESLLKQVHFFGGAVESDVNFNGVLTATDGPVVNHYVPGDIILRWLYPFGEEKLNPSPIGLGHASHRRIRNKDCSDIVKGHNSYAVFSSEILREFLK
jgi:hypothetical protein